MVIVATPSFISNNIFSNNVSYCLFYDNKNDNNLENNNTNLEKINNGTLILR